MVFGGVASEESVTLGRVDIAFAARACASRVLIAWLEQLDASKSFSCFDLI